MTSPTPLNGKKTLPLTADVLAVLDILVRGPVPALTINPDVVSHLRQDDLAVSVQRPSPVPAHKGRLIDHLEVTAAGRAAQHRAQEDAEQGILTELRAAGGTIEFFTDHGPGTALAVMRLALKGWIMNDGNRWVIGNAPQ